jgi:2-aminoadipate transaminase
VTLSLERRRRLVELANHYGAPIIEDDPHGQVRYEGQHLPPIVQIGAERHESAKADAEFTGDVLYLSTLSKTLAPGLRVAWLVAPQPVTARLVQMKQGTDLYTSTLCQMVAYEVAKEGFLDRHVRKVRAVYGERRDGDAGRARAALPRGGALDPAARWAVPLAHVALRPRLHGAAEGGARP